jgi:hypothetical protein
MAKRKKTTRGGSGRGKFKKGKTRRGKTHTQRGRSPNRPKNP